VEIKLFRKNSVPNMWLAEKPVACWPHRLLKIYL